MIEDEHQRLARLKPNLQRRAVIHQLTRDFFREQGFLEIETPIRTPCLIPESFITPFQSEDWFLSTSPEIYMKPLLAAGYEKIFQISHCFRKGEQGRHHNPEFSMLEWYRTGGDYIQMIQDTEDLFLNVASRLGLKRTLRYQGNDIDLTPPWPRIKVRNAFIIATGWDPIPTPDPLRFDTDLVSKVIPSFSKDRPTVLIDYPAPMAALARLKPDEPEIAERTEIFLGGLEIANAYSELTDVKEQEERFEHEIKQIQQEQGRKAVMPKKFLEAVSWLPGCGGIALGMDRLVMLFCDAVSIEEVMPFTINTQ